MAIVVHFKPTGMNAAKYDDVIKRLEDSGAGAPEGRLHHVCYGPSDSLKVVDVYESPAAFDKFGRTLLPILQAHGIEIEQPEVAEVHNIVKT